MGRLLLVVGILSNLGLFSAPVLGKPVMDFIIEPGKRAGPVTKGMTEAQLKAALPAGQARRVLVHIEEASYRCGTVIFPGSDNEAFVTWSSMEKVYDGDEPENVAECQNLPALSKPEEVRISKDFVRRPAQVSSWRATNGIRIGMTLTELEAAAGRPVEFSVCQCDYGGVVFGSPRQDLFADRFDLWLDVSAIPEDIEGKYVSKDEYRALKSSHVPKEIARKIVVRRIVVHLSDRPQTDKP